MSEQQTQKQFNKNREQQLCISSEEHHGCSQNKLNKMKFDSVLKLNYFATYTAIIINLALRFHPSVRWYLGRPSSRRVHDFHEDLTQQIITVSSLTLNCCFRQKYTTRGFEFDARF